ncbi:hypothetical protein CYLTODRAFT_459364 [Cylindrobasidium torrendii FP15055 ss-10]|uniref:Uncharacterized protein n=1 Tax=Cylindrobasidium torrendii FP15055 ss-10 TaxID=1314674 RepID=A0A0D7AXK5_9AGAR|nr:hypothetical protein CYLTODRAFT_459364 [Cylindrobasidium torrendii FP15055 ss-10]
MLIQQSSQSTEGLAHQILELCRDLEAFKGSTKCAFQERDDKIDTLQRELADTKNMCDALQLELADNKNVRDALQLELANNKIMCDALQLDTKDVCDALRATIDVQRLELSDARASIVALEQQTAEGIQQGDSRVLAQLTSSLEDSAALLAAESLILRCDVQEQRAEIDALQALEIESSVATLDSRSEQLREDFEVQKRAVSGLELGISGGFPQAGKSSAWATRSEISMTESPSAIWDTAWLFVSQKL